MKLDVLLVCIQKMIGDEDEMWRNLTEVGMELTGPQPPNTGCFSIQMDMASLMATGLRGVGRDDVPLLVA